LEKIKIWEEKLREEALGGTSSHFYYYLSKYEFRLKELYGMKVNDWLTFGK